ncbi:UpxY family transcription antiterminator [Leptospira idonii]|uniref:UpxY family transcription antiterminator n=1 Tax=Leptospira idonii TaxID=1193500 RepID=A0A4R9M2B9_9LEPT|nr:UpxY family transcription antiterminator [Leptospira idonii]TGN19857.1 UpxY family transcription antiterminator [Leptospira idonii]
MQGNDPIHSERHWFVVYTNPRAEKKLSRLFKKYKIEHYLPLVSKKQKWSDRIKTVELPCFQSYIFVKILFWQERVNVLQLPGAHHFVFEKGKPAIVDETILFGLQEGLTNHSESFEIRQEEALQKGKFVKVISGPLVGKVLEIEKRKNKVTVILRFPMLNQVATYEVNIEEIDWEEIQK